jgi:protein-S-isoprenylcysteine O-methyltransferase Ste14
VDPAWARVAVLAANVVLIAIRAPHGERSRKVPVRRDLRGVLETALLTLAWLTFMLTVVWVAWPPTLGFAAYPLRPAALGGGAALFALGLWLFHRSHADLGTNWSITLQVREGHGLVTSGVYARLRHPMYTSILLFGAGQALACPNWLAGGAYPAVTLLLVALRIGPEERMMREEFGAAWDAYAARTKRLLPGVW